MSAKQAKLLRKQLRAITEENLSNAQITAILAKCEDIINARMQEITEEVRKVMTEMNDRNKDVQGYLVRQATAAVIPAPQKSQETSAHETKGA